MVRLHINTGKAVSPVTAFSSPGQTLFGLSSIQLPIKGTDVLSDIQQHTLGSLQGLHIPSTSLVPEGHEHNWVIGLLTAHLGVKQAQASGTGAIGVVVAGVAAGVGSGSQIQHLYHAAVQLDHCDGQLCVATQHFGLFGESTSQVNWWPVRK